MLLMARSLLTASGDAPRGGVTGGAAAICDSMVAPPLRVMARRWRWGSGSGSLAVGQNFGRECVGNDCMTTPRRLL
jgi:hypothetical protein